MKQEFEFGALVAAPLVCSRYILAKHELLLMKKKKLSPSLMHSVDQLFRWMESNDECTASILLSLSMLRKILIISNKAKISLSGKVPLFISSIKSNICDVSWQD